MGNRQSEACLDWTLGFVVKLSCLVDGGTELARSMDFDDRESLERCASPDYRMGSEYRKGSGYYVRSDCRMRSYYRM